MANADYIEVKGPRSLDELVAVIGEPASDRRDPTAVELSSETVAIVQFDEVDEYPFLISIDSTNDVAERRIEALALFRRLVEATPWALLLTSDDDDVREERPAY
jgi:hypothetical protein